MKSRVTRGLTSIVMVMVLVLSAFSGLRTYAVNVGALVSESDCLTFTAEEDGSWVKVNKASGKLYYKNGNDWAEYTGDQISLNDGDSVRFRGQNVTFDTSYHVEIGGKVACSGDVVSLRLDSDGRFAGLSDYCFSYMFSDCTNLTSAPKFSATTLAKSCYMGMFEHCENLTTPPALPATTLADACYVGMFAGCNNLTTAPTLPATALKQACYAYMFQFCTKLTTPPELPATTLADSCYMDMFVGCKNLTTPPALPATTLAESCYAEMFMFCSNIKLSATSTGEYNIPYSVPSGGNGTTANYALTDMFDSTGGTFTGTPTINTTYYLKGATSAKTDISTATVNLGTDNSVSSIKVGETTITDLTGFEITYGTDDSHTATAVPTAAGKYHAYVTAKADNEKYTGEAKSAEFTVVTYTVTWKNGNTTLETDSNVAKGSAPSYNGEKPQKADDNTNIYTFSGWSNGTDTYGTSDTLPNVTADVTYTATFTSTEKPDVIKACNIKNPYYRLYANVPFYDGVNPNDLLDGAIHIVTYGDGNTMFPIVDAKGYSYKLYDQTGTEIEYTITDPQTFSGSSYGLDDGVTLYQKVLNFTRPENCNALYIVANAPYNAPTYTVTIPAAAQVSNSGSVEIAVTNVEHIPSGKTLTVSIAGEGENGAFVLKNGSSDTLPFSVVMLTESDGVLSESEALPANCAIINTRSNATAKLRFKEPSETDLAAVTKSGEYKGKVTFTVQLAEKAISGQPS